MKGVPFTEKRLQQWLKEDGGVVLQCKRDEIRCVVEVTPSGVTFTSASGKPLYNLNMFVEEFIFLAGKYGLSKFDCGVMVNDSFDITRSVVCSSKKVYDLKGRTFYPFKDGRGEQTYKARFYLYDLPGLKDSYDNRRKIMAEMARWGRWFATPETEVLNLANLGTLLNVQRVYEIYEAMVLAGHEGAMLKRLNHEYQPRRTTDWMKMKPEEEADGIIVGYNDGIGKFAGMVGSVRVEFADGSTTAVSGMTDAVRQALTAEPDYYIGKVLEVRYMMRDSQGGYRHPRWYRLHPDKDEL